MLSRRLPKRKKRSAKIPFLILIGLVLVWFVFVRGKDAPDTSTQGSGQSKQEQAFDKKQFSLSDPTSPWLVVNKKRPLSPAAYTPADLVNPAVPLQGAKANDDMKLRAEAAAALEGLVGAATNEGVKLILVSGYRSYATQTTIYKSEVNGFGQEQADKESARPGHSEHQTGWAADLGATNRNCEIKACFADSAEGKWLAAHAYKYGFIIRYAKDKTAITGYNYEPWHVRYVGVDLSTEMHAKNVAALEEFFGLSAAPSY